MPTTMIRVRAATHKALKELARSTGRPMQEVLARAVQEERRRLYLEALCAGYAALKKDSKAAAEYKKEIALWDTTGADGLEGL
ncbi:MAG: toxin-antitoxin system protein [Planctomycetota bacterium]